MSCFCSRASGEMNVCIWAPNRSYKFLILALGSCFEAVSVSQTCITVVFVLSAGPRPQPYSLLILFRAVAPLAIEEASSPLYWQQCSRHSALHRVSAYLLAACWECRPTVDF